MGFESVDTTTLLFSLAVIGMGSVVMYFMSMSSKRRTLVGPSKQFVSGDRPPKSIFIEDSMTVETSQSFDTLDHDEKTVVAGSARRVGGDTTGSPPSEATVSSDAKPPLQKKVRQVARKLLGIQKTPKGVLQTKCLAAGEEHAPCSPFMKETERVAI